MNAPLPYSAEVIRLWESNLTWLKAHSAAECIQWAEQSHSHLLALELYIRKCKLGRTDEKRCLIRWYLKQQGLGTKRSYDYKDLKGQKISGRDWSKYILKRKQKQEQRKGMNHA